jgi:regulator of sigma E protease
MNQGYEPLDITVKRNGEDLILTGVVFPGMQNEDIPEGVSFGQADFKVYREQAGFGAILKHTFFRSCSTVKMIFDQLGDLLTGRFGVEAMSGPVGVTEAMGDAASAGVQNFLYLVIVITINLGVFNLLPLPALDGGRLLFLLIEAIIGRPVDPKVEGYIHFAGLMLLFGLMIFVTFNDIKGLFF